MTEHKEITSIERSQVSIWKGASGQNLHSIKVTAKSNNEDDLKEAVRLACELEQQIIDSRPS